MPSLRAAITAMLASTAAALPSTSKLTARQMEYHDVARRQNAAAQKLGLGDFDILQFALTLENLEDTFYQQALALFPPSAFAALGLSSSQITDLHQISFTEATHVSLLQSSLAQAGIQPVQRCTYDFSSALVSAAAMLRTAAVLENVGLSAYLGAAPLLADNPALLGVAASILTVEARHQSSIRVFVGQQAVPQAFDAPLGPRAVFSLAAPFIKQCLPGSDLVLQPFPALQLADAAAATSAGSVLKLQAAASASTSAPQQFCAFTSGGVLPGGTVFVPFSAEGCAIPKGAAGITYLSLASSAPLDGVLTDDITVAGPIAITVS